MSIRHFTSLDCDICNRSLMDHYAFAQNDAKEARLAARKVGWIRRDGQDICDQCQENDEESQ